MAYLINAKSWGGGGTRLWKPETDPTESITENR